MGNYLLRSSGEDETERIRAEIRAEIYAQILEEDNERKAELDKREVQILKEEAERNAKLKKLEERRERHGLVARAKLLKPDDCEHATLTFQGVGREQSKRFYKRIMNEVILVKVDVREAKETHEITFSQKLAALISTQLTTGAILAIYLNEDGELNGEHAVWSCGKEIPDTQEKRNENAFTYLEPHHVHVSWGNNNEELLWVSLQIPAQLAQFNIEKLKNPNEKDKKVIPDKVVQLPQDMKFAASVKKTIGTPHMAFESSGKRMYVALKGPSAANPRGIRQFGVCPCCDEDAHAANFKFNNMELPETWAVWWGDLEQISVGHIEGSEDNNHVDGRVFESYKSPAMIAEDCNGHIFASQDAEQYVWHLGPGEQGASAKRIPYSPIRWQALDKLSGPSVVATPDKTSVFGVLLARNASLYQMKTQKQNKQAHITDDCTQDKDEHDNVTITLHHLPTLRLIDVKKTEVQYSQKWKEEVRSEIQASITVAFSEDWADKFQNAAMSLFSRHGGSSQMICHDRDGNNLRMLQPAGPSFKIHVDDIPVADKFPLHLRLEQAAGPAAEIEIYDKDKQQIEKIDDNPSGDPQETSFPLEIVRKTSREIRFIHMAFDQARITVDYTQDWDKQFQHAGEMLSPDGKQKICCCDKDQATLRVDQSEDSRGPRFTLPDIPEEDKFPLHLCIEKAPKRMYALSSSLLEPDTDGGGVCDAVLAFEFDEDWKRMTRVGIVVLPTPQCKAHRIRFFRPKPGVECLAVTEFSASSVVQVMNPNKINMTELNYNHDQKAGAVYYWLKENEFLCYEGFSLKGSQWDEKPDLPLEGAALTKEGPHQDQHWNAFGLAGGGNIRGHMYTPKECFSKAISINHKFAHAWLNLGNVGGGKLEKQSMTIKSPDDLAKQLNRAGLILSPDGKQDIICHDKDGAPLSVDRLEEPRGPRFQLHDTPEKDKFPLYLELKAGLEPREYTKDQCYAKAIECADDEDVDLKGLAWYSLGWAGGGEVNSFSANAEHCYSNAASKIYANKKEQRIAELLIEAEQAEKKINSKEADLQKVKEQLQRAMAEAEILKEIAAQHKLEEAQNEVAAMQKKLLQAEQEKLAQLEEIEEMMKALSQKDAAIKYLHEENKDSLEEIKDLRGKIQNREERALAAEGELDALKKGVDT